MSDETLLIEGYLKKVQPISNGFSRTRWFALTDRFLAYYEEEAGVQLAHCDVDNIDRITELDDDSFVIHGKVSVEGRGGS